MRIYGVLLLLATLFPVSGLLAADPAGGEPPSIDLKFSGYSFGQSPAANMVCQSGFCKSQAPGGDGRVTYPFSIYGTPGAVSTLSSLQIVNPRYTFWDDRLYRISFQVDCAPLEIIECLGDIEEALDREYDLTPVSAIDSQHFEAGKHVIIKEFVTESGAVIKMRGAVVKDEPSLPIVDIIDRGTTDLVGSTLSPNYKSRTLQPAAMPSKPD